MKNEGEFVEQKGFRLCFFDGRQPQQQLWSVAVYQNAEFWRPLDNDYELVIYFSDKDYYFSAPDRECVSVTNAQIVEETDDSMKIIISPESRIVIKKERTIIISF